MNPAQKAINKSLEKLAVKFASLVRKNFKENVVSIVLFGSVARKEANEHSDIDLLIVFKTLPTGRLARTALLEKIENALEKDLSALRAKGLFTNLNYLLKTKEEAENMRPLYFDLTDDAVYLYDKNNFFKAILNKLAARLKKLGSKRRKEGKVRYWELKPDIKPGEIFEI